jgi:uracil-DNA glycosylase
MIELQVIQNEVAACTKCELHKTRTQTVFSMVDLTQHYTRLLSKI